MSAKLTTILKFFECPSLKRYFENPYIDKIFALIFIAFSLFRSRSWLSNLNLDFITSVMLARYAVFLIFFLVRKKPKSVTCNLAVLFISFMGANTDLFFILLSLKGSATTALLPQVVIQSLTVLFSMGIIVAFFNLGRSMAIAPSLRTLKTNGLYAFVRHPWYTFWILGWLVYLLSKFNPLNLIQFFIGLLFIYLKLRLEEEFLEDYPEYKSYQESVKWKLFPYIY